MSLARINPAEEGKRAWHCLEFYDEERGYHGFSAALQTERQALGTLYEADLMAPPTTHIYYWEQDDSPIPNPPEGYSEGPLAERQT